ncbi:MAG: penicillin acylase family protein [Pseudomonadales bacterium]
MSSLIACGGGGGSSTPMTPVVVDPTPDPMPENPSPPPAQESYEASVRFTEFGIPHVAAADWRSLGFGHGYAYATQNYCVLMREVVVASGQSQRFFGDDGNLGSDFVFALLGEDIQAAFLDNLDADTSLLAGGYVAGFNRYLSDTGAANLPEGDAGCRNEPWVREISLQDFGRVLRKLAVRASTDPLAEFIFATNGPNTMTAANSKDPIKKPSHIDELLLSSAKKIEQGIEAMNFPKPEEIGSNAYAVGSSASQNDSGVLFGNPHFPWEGSNRFAMVHLTLTPEGASEPTYDVMGAALHGFPLVSIGFNADLAWSHTVSTGSRFVLYELQLNPDDPMQYEFDGEMREITSRTITIDTQDSAGAVEPQSHTFYFSHFGPILNLGGVNALLEGWPIAAGTGTVYALRDINLDNTRGLTTWRGIGQASSIAELQTALADLGIPWVNTIAADRAGQAFYGDISATANVTDDQQTNCITGPVAPLLTGFGLTTLDGRVSACELGTDADAPLPGVIGFDRLPKLVNDTYVSNSNDSYWLTNPSSLLTGFPSIVGAEEVEQSLRTRLGFVQMEERLAGADDMGAPGVTPMLLQDMLFGSRNYAAELVLDDVNNLCTATVDWSPFSSNPTDMTQACNILAGWDSRHNNSSIGGHIFYEFWKTARDIDDLWSVPFDPADPVNTPNTVNVGNAAVISAARDALVAGVDRLLAADIPLNAEWGSVQFSERNGVRIPIHGGSGSMLFSVITSDLNDNEGYSSIRHGNSFMQTVGWDSTECPDAFGLLSYSQSSDPASDNYADQTELYSNKEWVDMPFCEADIAATQVGETIVLEQAIP